jgi:galactokinase
VKTSFYWLGSVLSSEQPSSNVAIEALTTFRKLFGIDPEALVSAPGRIDLLNTHQDYKGLPVVGVAINLRTFIAGSRSERCVIYSLTVNERDEFGSNVGLKGGKWFGDYFRAAFMALRKRGYQVGCVKAVVSSNVPIGSGLASSGALLVAFVKLLDALYNLGMDIKEIAELAYIAENNIMGIPCGRLDQYTSAYGGIVLIHTLS